MIATVFCKKDGVCFKARIVLFFLGAFRASLIGSVIFFSLHLSPLDSKYYRHSISYSIFKDISPKIYLVALKGYGKFNSKIVANKEVEEYYEAEKPLPGNNKERY